MNKSIEILKSIYKPYKYTIKGKSTILETTSGDFVLKNKNKDLNQLFTYLSSRGFYNFPSLVDSSRRDVNVFEYVENMDMPIEQKCDDLIDIIASLHNKTSYFKEVSADNYKVIYENIKGNIEYLKNYYNVLYEKSFNEEYMSPSSYELTRNFYKINEMFIYLDRELDNWFELVKDSNKIRVAVVHNNLELKHFLKSMNKEAIISWDNYMIDTPVVDLVNLYKKEYLNIDFSAALKRYLYKFPLLPYEEKLLFILMTLPPKVSEGDSEFEKCKNLSKVLDYIFKTEALIRPYNTTDKEKE